MTMRPDEQRRRIARTSPGRRTAEDGARGRECDQRNSLDYAGSIDGRDFVALGHQMAPLFDPCDQMIADAQRVRHCG